MLLYTIDFLVTGDGLVFDTSSSYIIQNNNTYFVTTQRLICEKNQKPGSNLCEIMRKENDFPPNFNETFFFSWQNEINTENMVSSIDSDKQDSPPPKPPRTRRYCASHFERILHLLAVN